MFPRYFAGCMPFLRGFHSEDDRKRISLPSSERGKGIRRVMERARDGGCEILDSLLDSATNEELMLPDL